MYIPQQKKWNRINFHLSTQDNTHSVQNHERDFPLSGKKLLWCRIFLFWCIDCNTCTIISPVSFYRAINYLKCPLEIEESILC